MTSDSPLRIAILDDYLEIALRCADWTTALSGAELTVFAWHLGGQARVIEALQSFDVIVAMRERTRFPASVIEALPALKLLVSTGTTNSAIDLDACARRGVTVGWAPSVPSAFESTSEMTWALILALHKRLPQQDAALRQGSWQTHMTETVVGKTLGLLGLGRIGSNVAKVGAVFGMQLIAWSPNLDTASAAAKGVRRVDKHELFAASDVLSLHMVLSERSAGIVDRAALQSMKRSAYLVNTARAGLVEEGALLEALERKWIAGAALDVYPVEPLDATDPILRHDNVVLSPHLGYVTGDTMRAFYGNAVARIRQWIATGQ